MVSTATIQEHSVLLNYGTFNASAGVLIFAGVFNTSHSKLLITIKNLVMRTHSLNMLNNLNFTAIKDMIVSIKNSNSVSFSHKQHTTFSSAELWNIQRQRRSLNLRRGFSFL